MKKTNNITKPNRVLRRMVKKLFSSLQKNQNNKCHQNFAKLMDKLQEIEASIEIIAREMHRQINQGR